MKKLFFLIIISFFLLPSFSNAQTPTVTYNASVIKETSATITGVINNTKSLNFGYSILFGSTPGLLLNAVPIFPNLDGSYAVEIKNLRGSTNYYYKMVFGPVATSVGPEKTFKTSASSLIINHKNISQNSAVLWGKVSDGHPDFVIKYGKTERLSDGSFAVIVDTQGNFEDIFPFSFPPNTTIYYRAVNPILPLIFYSPLRSFKTLNESVIFDFRNLTSSSVSVVGTINGAPAPKVLLGLSSTTFDWENDPDIDANGNWTANFNGLDPSTTYYIRIVKRLDPSFTYAMKPFTTASSNINLDFFNITDTSMTISGNLPFGTSAIVLCYATSPENLATNAANCGSGPVVGVPPDFLMFETTYTNFAPNTTYYFVARNEQYTKDISQVFSAQTFPTSTPGTIGNNITLEGGPSSLVSCVGLKKGSGQAYNCDFNALMGLVNNVINFLLKTIALPLFALIFAYVGFLYMTSADDPGKRTKAKEILKNSVVGFMIAMAAFLIVKTILTTLGYSGINYLDFIL